METFNDLALFLAGFNVTITSVYRTKDGQWVCRMAKGNREWDSWGDTLHEALDSCSECVRADFKRVTTGI